MQEVILKLGGEGETLSLIGTRGTDGLRKYHIQTSSEALSELLSESDSLPSSKQQRQIKVSSWKKACDLLEQYPSWYKLHQIDIHPDFASKIHKLFSTKNDSSIHHNKITDIFRPDNTSNTDTKLHVNTQLNSISIDNESLIGLQADYQIIDDLAITGQLIGHSGNKRDSGIEWLYLTYTPSNTLKFKLGKQRTPFLSYSDVIDVGYAYPWATLPQQTYPRHFFLHLMA